MKRGFIVKFFKSNKGKTMQKSRKILTPLGTLMKVSFFQFMLTIIVIGYTYGLPVRAQEIVTQKVDLSVNQKAI